MKILFVTSVPLRPINDGVRIPAANHFSALTEIFEVHLLMLDPRDKPAESSEVEETLALVSTSARVPILRVTKTKAVFRELVYSEPYFGAFEFEEEKLPEWLKETAYDCVWCATATTVGMFSLERIRARVTTKKFIAGLSDMHSLVVARQAAEASKTISLYYKSISRLKLILRSKIILRAEGSMLENFDLVTMQTQKELDWVKTHFGTITSKSMLLPNGVDPALFDLPLESRLNSMIFVGALHGVYGERLNWFVKQVLCQVRKTHPDLKMFVVGKGADEKLRKTLKVNSVNYTPYVESIKKIYADHAILVAPIFKGFGLINKVVEAMSAGCLVIGDNTAFNGIDGFKAGVHGLVADDYEDFQVKICDCLRSVNYYIGIREKARELVLAKFSWQSRYEILQEQIKNLISEG